jgi:hypothetical protein
MMKRFYAKGFAALVAVWLTSGTASAATIEIGFLSFDDTGSASSFNITNLTGVGWPLETLLDFDVTTLVADLEGIGPVTIDNTYFTQDPVSGNLDCTASGFATSGGCNFATYNILGVTLMGTLSWTSDLVGLPPGFSGIESAFEAILAPSAGPYLTAGLDGVTIEATLVPSAPASMPEPSTMMMFQLAIGAALFGRRLIPRQRRGLPSNE